MVRCADAFIRTKGTSRVPLSQATVANDDGRTVRHSTTMKAMWRLSHFFLLAATVAVICLSGARGHAQEIDPSARAVARDLGYAGVAAFERGDFQAAADKLERAFKILEAPSLGLWSARALVKLGKLVQAAERYRLVGRINTGAGELAVQRQAQQDAATELAALEKRIPSIVVQVEGGSPGSRARESRLAPGDRQTGRADRGADRVARGGRAKAGDTALRVVGKVAARTFCDGRTTLG
jgi:hypothetical protein